MEDPLAVSVTAEPPELTMTSTLIVTPSVNGPATTWNGIVPLSAAAVPDAGPYVKFATGLTGVPAGTSTVATRLRALTVSVFEAAITPVISRIPVTLGVMGTSVPAAPVLSTFPHEMGAFPAGAVCGADGPDAELRAKMLVAPVAPVLPVDPVAPVAPVLPVTPV